MTTCYHPVHRLFFVHVPKCAGSAITGELRTSDGLWSARFVDDKLPGWVRDGLPNGHQPVRAIEMLTGKPLNWWKKIIVPIRNPFDQQLSQWSFWRQRAKSRIAAGEAYHIDERCSVSLTLDRFVANPQSNGPVYTCGRRWREAGGVYRWWCTNWAGEIPGNVHILRVEDLPGNLSECLGVDCSDLKVTNTSEHQRWQDAYSTDGLRAVRDKYAWSLSTWYPEILQEVDDIITMREAEAVAPGLTSAGSTA